VPASVGAEEAACHVYRRCVERTLERLSVLREEITLCVEPADATDRIRTWLGSSWPALPQSGGTLGERLADATNRAFTEGAHRVVVIGTDSPWLDEALIEEAFLSQERADLVLGPAADGGYYLVGLAKPVPGLFHGISWSTNQVLNQTLAAARRLGFVASLLRRDYDIDQLEDLHRWMDSDPCHGVTMPIPATCRVTCTARRMSHA
jgi:rSAM/selenodomain-associated transferase 1